MDRIANELMVSVEVVEHLFATGPARTFRVEHGPDPDARIVNVRWNGNWIILEYDRPVEEPTFYRETGA